MVLMSVALWIRGVADLEAGLSRRIPICGCAAHAAGATVYDINPCLPEFYSQRNSRSGLRRNHVES
jgi:hypothetical protein